MNHSVNIEQVTDITGNQTNRERLKGQTASETSVNLTAFNGGLPWGVVLIAGGIAVYFSLPFEPSPTMIALLIISLVLLWAMTTNNRALHIPLTILLIFTLGFSVAVYRANAIATPLLGKSWKSYTIRLKVEETHTQSANRIRYTGVPLYLGRLDKDRWPKRIRLSAPDQGPRFLFGDVICGRVNLKRPGGPVRPGGYDFGRTLWFKGIGGTGYALSGLKVCNHSDKSLGKRSVSSSFLKVIAIVKAAIASKLEAGLDETSEALAKALIIGERGGIPRDHLEAVRKAGLGHLLAISGLHMAVFAGTVFFLVRALLALSPTLALNHPIKKWAAFIALLSGALYFLISGQSIPTQRAFIMISIMFAAILLERPALTLRNVTLAALVILCLRPESLLSPGFQMSFAAVTALIAIYQRVTKRDTEVSTFKPEKSPLSQAVIYAGGILMTSLIASVATAPYAIYHFHQISYLGPVGNLLAIPVFTFLLMPAAVLTLILIPFGLEGITLPLLDKSIDMLLAIAHWTASFEPALIYTGEITIYAVLFITMAALILIFINYTTARLSAIALLLAALYTAKPANRPDLYINKQGTVIAVRGPDGGLEAIDGRKGNYELSKWLRADGDRRAPGEVRHGKTLICDDTACSAKVKGRVITLIKSLAALQEACSRANILIYNRRITRACPQPQKIISKDELAYNGAMTVFIKTLSTEGKASDKGRRAKGRKKMIIQKSANTTRRHRLWASR